jgi:hypothetical protein
MLEVSDRSGAIDRAKEDTMETATLEAHEVFRFLDAMQKLQALVLNLPLELDESSRP